MVRQWQTFFYEERYSSVDLTMQPDFVKLAESFGALGFSVETKADFDKAFKNALNSQLPSLLEVKVDRMESVFPMVAAGDAIYNMMLN